MGENQSWLFDPTFNRSVKVESKSVQDDADRLAHDPAFQLAVWDRRGDDVIDERLASQPTQSRLISILAREENREKFRDGLFQSISRYVLSAGPRRPVHRATIDVDSFPIEVHGAQSGAVYNGHYGAKIYHPLVASICVDGKYDAARPESRLGNGFSGARLRPGNVHTADDSLPFIQAVASAPLGTCVRLPWLTIAPSTLVLCRRVSARDPLLPCATLARSARGASG